MAAVEPAAHTAWMNRLGGAVLGLPYGQVRLVDSDPGWPHAFEVLAAELRGALGELAVAVEHVGSTAVPGLVAKPILDLAVGLAPGARTDRVRPAIEQLGYVFRGDKGDTGGLLFVLEDPPAHRIAHLHVVPHGGQRWQRYLAFRDRLRIDPDARAAYAGVKRRLGEQFAGDRQAYTAGKGAFVVDVLSRGGPQMGQLDPEGYIRPEADVANVQPEYQGLPDAAAALLVEAFGPRLHSAYLYGSVVRGNAVPGRSDVDVVAVLRPAPTDEDRVRADRVERALVERFPVLSSAGIGITHLEEVRSPAQRYGLQVFLRELAVCIGGEDLRPGLPRTRPSAAVAAGFHADTHAVLARARQTLASSTDPDVIRRVSRMASKRMVQVAFAVVMAREGVWATVLEEQAAAVGAVFPQWAEAARRAAEQGRRPVADPGVVRELLDSFGRWAEDALDEAVSDASSSDGRAR